MSDDKKSGGRPVLDWIIGTPTQDLLSGEYGEPAPGKRSWTAPRITCADGASLSVQASRTHYCTPRDSVGPWIEVEVGYPSVAPPETWREFCEDWEHPTDTVYGYVPIDLVRKFIADHGGEVIAERPR